MVRYARKLEALRMPFMATQTAHKSRCKCCESTFDEYYTPGYCSEACYYRFKGSKAVNILRHDHRLCASCGRWIKEINRPTDEWKHYRGSAYQIALENGATLSKENGQQLLDLTQVRDIRPVAVDSVIGFQDATPNAEPVEKEYDIDEYRRHYGTGLGCTCGVTDTRIVDDTLRGIELASVLANYVTVFRALEREGQLDQRIDKDRFFESFKETRDFELSLGKGLHE